MAMHESWMPSDSVGGWATCDECHTMIVENRRADLLTRARQGQSGRQVYGGSIEGPAQAILAGVGHQGGSRQHRRRLE